MKARVQAGALSELGKRRVSEPRGDEIGGTC